MQPNKDISDKLTALLNPVVEDLGMELVEVSMKGENQRSILSIVIDKQGGVTVDDCALVSDKISLVLDVEDIIQHKYYLEVGSPGIFRELKTEKDFKRSIGKRVKAVLNEPIEKQIQFIGTLTDAKGDELTIEADDRQFTIDLPRLKKIQLFPDI